MIANNERQVASAQAAALKKGSSSMKRQPTTTTTRNMCFCLLFIAISLIAICITAAQAEHMHEEGKHKFHPYKYGYKVIDHKGNKQWKQEESHTPHEVKGSYGYKDKHGLFREVSYIADKHGFRAKIKTNELHGKVKSPANVEIISEPSYHGHSGHGAPSQVHVAVQAAPRAQTRLPVPMAAAAASPANVAVAPAATAAAAAAAAEEDDQQQE